MVRGIYADYTDQIEPFGLDEAWLDVTGSATVRGDGETIANEIRQRVKDEIGITGSVGVADNKIFAKLGSDMKKPDATTVITRQNYKELVWQLPVEELLYVGRSTRHKLYLYNILTIGDLANCDRKLLHANLGKWGETLWTFANGYDQSPVMKQGEESVIKSIGNSTTTPRDLVNENDVKMTLCVLAESVAERLREHGLKCRTVQIHVRDNTLGTFERQGKLPRPTQLSGEITALAMSLFRASYRWDKPIRSLGVRGADLVSVDGDRQLTFLPDDRREERGVQLERTVDDIRRRFGHFSIQKALMLTDRPLTGLNPKDDHVIHPMSYF
jgi:DNA polymerase-4